MHWARARYTVPWESPDAVTCWWKVMKCSMHGTHAKGGGGFHPTKWRTASEPGVLKTDLPDTEIVIMHRHRLLNTALDHG